MKDIEYQARSFRLSEEVYEELAKRRQNFNSWNLMFKNLLGIKTAFKMKQKRK